MLLRIKNFLVLVGKKLVKWFLRWLISFGYITDGMINFFTLGFLPHKLQPKATLKLAKIYSMIIFRMDV